MKLKNKLLPLVGIAALSSAIAPLSIITSCSKNNQVTEMIDITNGYSYHAGTYAGKDALNQRTATEAFIAAVKENPNVFKDDLLASYFDFYNNQAKESINMKIASEHSDIKGEFTTHLTSAKVGITNPVFDKVNVVYPAEGSYPYTVISFKMKYEVKFTTKASSSDRSIISADTVYAGEMEFKNLPFYAYLSNKNDNHISEWSIGVSDLILNNLYILQYMKGWNVNSSYTLSTSTLLSEPGQKDQATETSQSSKIELKTYADIAKIIQDDNVEQRAELQSLAVFDFASSYLSQAKIAPEIFAKGLKGSVIAEGGEVVGAQITGFYIPLYAELKEKISEHWGEGKPLEQLIDIIPTKDIKLVSSDGLYRATIDQTNPFSLFFGDEVTGPDEIEEIGVALNLVWEQGRAPSIGEKLQFVNLGVAPSYDVTIETFFDGVYPSQPDASYKTTIYTNRSFVTVTVAGDVVKEEEATPYFDDQFSNAIGKWTRGYKMSGIKDPDGGFTNIIVWDRFNAQIRLALPIKSDVEVPQDIQPVQNPVSGHCVDIGKIAIENKSGQGIEYSNVYEQENIPEPTISFVAPREDDPELTAPLYCIITISVNPGNFFQFIYENQNDPYYTQLVMTLYEDFTIYYSVNGGGTIAQTIHLNSAESESKILDFAV